SLDFLQNSTQSPVISVAPVVFPTATLVQAFYDGMKLHPPARGCVKVTNLTHSMESSMPKVVPALLVTKSIVLNFDAERRLMLLPKSSFQAENRSNEGLSRHMGPPHWNLETPKAQRNHHPERYFRRSRTRRKLFKWNPTLKRMDRQLSS
ncbi:unnamed protein product, partial [Hymenolepis diminuta]